MRKTIKPLPSPYHYPVSSAYLFLLQTTDCIEFDSPSCGREGRETRVYDKRRAHRCGRWRDREFAVLSDLASQTCPRAVQLVDFWVFSQFSHCEPFFEHITLVPYWDYGNIEDGRGKWYSVPSTFQAPRKVLQTHCFILLILTITLWSRDHYPYFTVEETKVYELRGKISCPKSCKLVAKGSRI